MTQVKNIEFLHSVTEYSGGEMQTSINSIIIMLRMLSLLIIDLSLLIINLELTKNKRKQQPKQRILLIS